VPNRIQVDRSEPGVSIVSLLGEHEAYSALDLEQKLDGAVRTGETVVVDLSRAEFLDSTIVAVLLRTRDLAERKGLRFALVMDDSTGWAVRKLFAVTGLEDMLPIAPSRAEALAS
jgi:anti-anti-sigma factor